MHTLPEKDVVLVGVGHTNAEVLRRWRMQALPRVRLTCVSDHPVATYSGMLPGVLARQYPPERMEIDLVRLCAAAGARLILGDVRGVDIGVRRVLVSGRPPVPFDVLSIGVGSVPSVAGVDIADDSRLLLVKPMQTFLSRLEALAGRVAAGHSGRVRVGIVGAGAGGVELALTLPRHLRDAFAADTRIQTIIVTADDRLVPGSLAGTARRLGRALARRGIDVTLGRRVVRIDGRDLALDDGSRLTADLIVWATGAAPPPVLDRIDLPKDARGFLLTSDTLQTTGGAPIFAVGDSGTIAGRPTPKAGVYAVRHGPVLWDNIARTLAGATLYRYRPQRGFLKLMNTGDGRAIGEWRGLSFEGRWAWRLKDAIDRGFIDRYQHVAPMAARPAPPAESPAPMRCAGCGGKIGASVLARVLERLDVPPSDHVLVGLDRPDDAAVVLPPGGRPVHVTVDFFEAPLDDPYLVGRIAALNAASDAFAMSACPWAALAMVTVPEGPSPQQEELLYQVLAGSLQELRRMNATLVGGHTIEGPRLTVGFTVLGAEAAGGRRLKGGLRAGDRLVLTKPLGTGVLLAAHARAACRARWFSPLLASMLVSNGPAAACLSEFAVSAVTDVTGFGLAGHLREMLRAGDMAARLDLDALPLLPGAITLFRDGLESTLAPANRTVEPDIVGSRDLTDPRYRALFDPQTGGGLLMGVAPASAAALLARLHSLGYAASGVIGTVEAATEGEPRLRVASG